MSFNYSLDFVCSLATEQGITVCTQTLISLTYPRQWITNEHVDHAGTAEAGVHEDHARGLFADFADDGCFFATFDIQASKSYSMPPCPFSRHRFLGRRCVRYSSSIAKIACLLEDSHG